MYDKQASLLMCFVLQPAFCIAVHQIGIEQHNLELASTAQLGFSEAQYGCVASVCLSGKATANLQHGVANPTLY